ncbi:type 1 glutamine amidotransferase domain-containing protein [Oxalobacteraceae bacterium A2-2]
MKLIATLGLAVAALLSTNAIAAGKGKVLVLLSSESVLPLKEGKTYSTGYYLNEFGVPTDALIKAGYTPVLVTPKGNAPAVDRNSVAPQYFGGSEAEMQRIQAVVNGLPDIGKTLSVEQVLGSDLGQYAAIFIPGGHGPLIDLANNPQVGRLLRHFHEAGKPTAAICHGPIALLSAQADPAGYERAMIAGQAPTAREWIYDGYKMTIFSDPEEQVFESSLDGARVRYSPAAAMKGAGGDTSYAPAWQPKVVADRELITAQNPFSDHAVAAALIARLQGKTE